MSKPMSIDATECVGSGTPHSILTPTIAHSGHFMVDPNLTSPTPQGPIRGTTLGVTPPPTSTQTIDNSPPLAPHATPPSAPGPWVRRQWLDESPPTMRWTLLEASLLCGFKWAEFERSLNRSPWESMKSLNQHWENTIEEMKKHGSSKKKWEKWWSSFKRCLIIRGIFHLAILVIMSWILTSIKIFTYCLPFLMRHLLLWSCGSLYIVWWIQDLVRSKIHLYQIRKRTRVPMMKETPKTTRRQRILALQIQYASLTVDSSHKFFCPWIVSRCSWPEEELHLASGWPYN